MKPKRKKIIKWDQLTDNKNSFGVVSGEQFLLKCCDCGLVHRVVAVVDPKDKKWIGIAMKREALAGGEDG